MRIVDAPEAVSRLACRPLLFGVLLMLLGPVAAPAAAANRDSLLTEPGVYVTFATFQFDEDWPHLEASARQTAARAARETLQEHADSVAIDAYLARGLADRVDFFLRLHALELGENQRVVTDLLATPLGRHLKLVGTYNGLTKKANYMPGLPDEMKATLKAPSDPGPKPYAIMVPIRKAASWWMLSRDERQKLMEEHTRATLPYLKTVKRKLYHSSGLDDYDFLTYFETSKLDDFNNLIISLQMIEEYRHTTRFGHPILIGTPHTIGEVLETLAK